MSAVQTLERKPSLRIGEDIIGASRCMSPERMLWYVHSLSEFARIGRPERDVTRDHNNNLHSGNIHTNEDYAKSQGLPGIIADGPISMNWLLGHLVDIFGTDALQNGKFDSKHIRPARRDVIITSKATIESAEPTGDGRWLYRVKLWTEDPEGQPLTVGNAEVTTDVRPN